MAAWKVQGKNASYATLAVRWSWSLTHQVTPPSDEDPQAAIAISDNGDSAISLCNGISLSLGISMEVKSIGCAMCDGLDHSYGTRNIL